jgi:hypothetical protein
VEKSIREIIFSNGVPLLVYTDDEDMKDFQYFLLNKVIINQDYYLLNSYIITFNDDNIKAFTLNDESRKSNESMLSLIREIYLKYKDDGIKELLFSKNQLSKLGVHKLTTDNAKKIKGSNLRAMVEHSGENLIPENQDLLSFTGELFTIFSFLSTKKEQDRSFHRIHKDH